MGEGRPTVGVDHSEPQVLQGFVGQGVRRPPARGLGLGAGLHLSGDVHGHLGHQRRGQMRQGIRRVEPVYGEVVLR